MPSPRPTYFTGTCSSWAMAMTMPPLAVPSSFVRMMPVRFVGVGEGIDDLRPFDAGEFTKELF